MADQVGVAVQGTGWVSTAHIRAYQRDPRVRVVALGSRTREGAQRKARETGLDVPVFESFDDLLAHPEVDAVSICTPEARHSAETVKAAAAGKHILIEKPVATSLDELRQMRDAVRGAGVRTVASFVLRWNPAVLNLQALRSEGMLGTVFYVQTDYWHNRIQAGLGPKDRAVGAMLSGGCHAMDAARYLMGSDIVEVSALSWPDAPRDLATERTVSDRSGEANTVALVRFANGGMGKVSACTSQWMPYNFNIDVFGTDGAVRDNRLYTKKLPGLTGFAELPTILPDSGDVTHHPFPQEIEHFIDCIVSGQESHVSLEDTVNTHEACFAAEMSANQGGTPVTCPLL